MRALAEGVRVFAASLVLSAVLASSFPGIPHLWLWSIGIVGVLTLIYTFEGGIAAVIWTDLIQFVIYIGGSLLAAYELVHLTPGGWSGDRRAPRRRRGSCRCFSFSWDVTVPFTFWAGLIGGTFLTNASHGTDQLLVQRLLTCRNLRDSQKAIITSGFIVLAAVRAVPRHRHHAVRLLPARAAAGDHHQRRDLSRASSSRRCRTASRGWSSPPSSPPRCRT